MKTIRLMMFLLTAMLIFYSMAYAAKEVRPEYNGAIVKRAGDTALYLVDEGRLRHIPNPTTYNILFDNPNCVETDSWLVENTVIGTPLVAYKNTLKMSNGNLTGKLLGSFIMVDPRENNSNKLYFAEFYPNDGYKRHIANPNVFKKYCFNGQLILPENNISVYIYMNKILPNFIDRGTLY